LSAVIISHPLSEVMVSLLPVVNIGIRQDGRERSSNVIDVTHDKNEIADAIIYMIENPVKTKEFGLKAKEKAKMFSAAIMVSKIQNVYDEILS